VYIIPGVMNETLVEKKLLMKGIRVYTGFREAKSSRCDGNEIIEPSSMSCIGVYTPA